MKQEIYVREETVWIRDFDDKTPEQAAELVLSYSKKLKKGEIGRFVTDYCDYDEPGLEFHIYRLETDAEQAEREANEAAELAEKARKKLEREAKKQARAAALIAQDQAAELALLAQLKAKYEGVES